MSLQPADNSPRGTFASSNDILQDAVGERLHAWINTSPARPAPRRRPSRPRLPRSKAPLSPASARCCWPRVSAGTAGRRPRRRQRRSCIPRRRRWRRRGITPSQTRFGRPAHLPGGKKRHRRRMGSAPKFPRRRGGRLILPPTASWPSWEAERPSCRRSGRQFRPRLADERAQAKAWSSIFS